MPTDRHTLGIACRNASLIFLIAGTIPNMRAQAPQPADLPAGALLASARGPLELGAGSSSSSTPANAAAPDLFDLKAAEIANSQPPPRRYPRPNFSDKNSNPDGSPKYTFFGGMGLTVPIGNTHYYETPSYGFQVGGGRNFNKNVGLMLQFDYDHFGLQGATLENETYLYGVLLGCTPTQISAGTCVSGLDGNNHVWSFTLDPTYTFTTRGSAGAYLVAGAGFFHKVTNFTQPTTEEECSIYGCGYFNVNEVVAHYTSNAPGFNAGIGLTFKAGKFSSEHVFAEARYVLVLNSQRDGLTASNINTTAGQAYYNSGATDYYPANSNRTTYTAYKAGIRF
jgi:hypothetical protein